MKSVRVFSQPAHESDSSGVECGSEQGTSQDLVSASTDVLVAVYLLPQAGA